MNIAYSHFTIQKGGLKGGLKFGQKRWTGALQHAQSDEGQEPLGGQICRRTRLVAREVEQERWQVSAALLCSRAAQRDGA